MAFGERHIPAEKLVDTEDKYFEFDRMSVGRWEYVQGQIRAMSSGTASHSMIAVNIAAALRAALLFKGCRVFGSDMRVHMGKGVNTFPDVSVVCGPLSFYRGRTDTLVSQHEARAELYTRKGDHWEYREITGLDQTVTLPSVEVTLALSDVYALVKWPSSTGA